MNKKYTEKKNLLYLFEELKNEIEQIKKIKFLHNKLNLFSPCFWYNENQAFRNLKNPA